MALQIAVAAALGIARADEAAPQLQAPAETPAPAARKTLTFTQDDQDALARGPVPLGRYIAGGIVGPHWQNVAYRRAKSKRDADDQAWSPFLAPVSADALALGIQFRF